jgi:two-component system CheB/CheR fusion protein
MMDNQSRSTPNESEEVLLKLAREQVKHHAVMLLDPAGRVVSWLYGAQEILGYAAAEMIGQPLDVLFTPEDQALGIPRHEIEIATKDGRAEDDRWAVRKDQIRIWVNGALSALRDGDGRLVGFSKITSDRTDQKAKMDFLENRIEALAQADVRRRVFLGALAHELRNPLAALVSASELIRMTTPEGDQLEMPLQIIARQVDALRRLVDDLSDATRIGAGKVRLELAEIDLKKVVDEAVDCCRPHIDERRHDFRAILPDGPIYVEADAARLRQVIVNLLNNAIKYTDEGGHVWLKATVEGQEAVVRVEDDGVGVSPDMLPHIFDLFTQVESTVSKSAGGLGIGLSLVKDLVTLHNGTVQVRSEGAGKGSEFTVRLPRRQPRPTGSQGDRGDGGRR